MSDVYDTARCLAPQGLRAEACGRCYVCVILNCRSERDAARAERDAAVATTVERCAREAESDPMLANGRIIAARIRTLAPPTPGVPTAQRRCERTCELWPRCACGDLVGTPTCTTCNRGVPGCVYTHVGEPGHETHSDDDEEHNCPACTPGVPVGATAPIIGSHDEQLAGNPPLCAMCGDSGEVSMRNLADQLVRRPCPNCRRTPLGGPTPAGLPDTLCRDPECEVDGDHWHVAPASPPETRDNIAPAAASPLPETPCPECRGPMPCSRTIRCREANAAAGRRPGGQP